MISVERAALNVIHCANQCVFYVNVFTQGYTVVHKTTQVFLLFLLKLPPFAKTRPKLLVVFCSYIHPHPSKGLLIKKFCTKKPHAGEGAEHDRSIPPSGILNYECDIPGAIDLLFSSEWAEKQSQERQYFVRLRRTYSNADWWLPSFGVRYLVCEQFEFADVMSYNSSSYEVFHSKVFLFLRFTAQNVL